MVLDEVLSAGELHRIREILAGVPFRDGRLTAGPAAREAKNNDQAAGDHPEVTALAHSVRAALHKHRTFQALVRPVRWSNLIFSRYVAGQRYGQHTDDATMSDEHGWPLRTDISFTLFLSDPSSYDGGELRVLDAGYARTIKPAAGSVALYGTGLVHEVMPVKSGTRLACVGWIQSQVRRADQRELLFDLDCVRREFSDERGLLLLDKAIGNLLRMWGEH